LIIYTEELSLLTACKCEISYLSNIDKEMQKFGISTRKSTQLILSVVETADKQPVDCS